MTPRCPPPGENAQFTPVSGTPYQRVNSDAKTPDNGLGRWLYFERGIFQVTLRFPNRDRSSQRRSALRRAARPLQTRNDARWSAIQVIVIETPKASPSMVDGDRYCVPICHPISVSDFNLIPARAGHRSPPHQRAFFFCPQRANHSLKGGRRWQSRQGIFKQTRLARQSPRRSGVPRGRLSCAAKLDIQSFRRKATPRKTRSPQRNRSSALRHGVRLVNGKLSGNLSPGTYSDPLSALLRDFAG